MKIEEFVSLCEELKQELLRKWVTYDSCAICQGLQYLIINADIKSCIDNYINKLKEFQNIMLIILYNNLGLKYPIKYYVWSKRVVNPRLKFINDVIEQAKLGIKFDEIIVSINREDI